MHSEPNYSLPWQRKRQISSTGSGFVISGKRILTNAHCVDHHTQVLAPLGCAAADPMQACATGFCTSTIAAAVSALPRHDDCRKYHCSYSRGNPLSGPCKGSALSLHVLHQTLNPNHES